MSEVIYLDASTLQSQPARARRPLGPRAFVREVQPGVWIVHDDSDTKGGCFRSHDTAFRFAEEEFGMNVEIVVQPRFAPPSKQAVSHINQSASVAHRAVAAH